jgi:hypothetical protein
LGVCFLKLILFVVPCVSGFIEFYYLFLFPDFKIKELVAYVSCCFININNGLLVVKCYSSLVVSGFPRNEFNSCILFNFCCFSIYFYLMLRSRGISSLFYLL